MEELRKYEDKDFEDLVLYVREHWNASPRKEENLKYLIEEYEGEKTDSFLDDITALISDWAMHKKKIDEESLWSRVTEYDVLENLPKRKEDDSLYAIVLNEEYPERTEAFEMPKKFAILYDSAESGDYDWEEFKEEAEEYLRSRIIHITSGVIDIQYYFCKGRPSFDINYLSDYED